jgi:predicted acyltransferase
VTTTAGRVGALDLLRGLAIAAMIVVNNPGNWNSVYPQLSHAAWNGVTVADLIFPGFIFVMGVAMALSFASRARDAARARHLSHSVMTRAALLVLLGLFLNLAASWPHPASMRIPGVLQRIGITYLCAALIALGATPRQQWFAAAALLLSHWIILAAPLGLPGSGSLQPGHNVAAFLDRALFGSHTLSAAGDPEGLLGVLSSVATALLGVAAGRWLLVHNVRQDGSAQRGPSMVPLAAAGASAIAAAYVWSFAVPLNKSLWTPSFALLSAGLATLCLALFVWLDRSRVRRALAPLTWLGMNPLAIYFSSELLSNLLQRPGLSMNGSRLAPKDWFYWSVLVPRFHDVGGVRSSCAYALLYTLLWIGVAAWMRWRGVRVRV